MIVETVIKFNPVNFESVMIIYWLIAMNTALLSGAALSYNPVLVCLALVLVSLTSGLLLGLTMSKWLMMGVILIFLGGMMVVFIYVTALTGAQKLFTPSYKKLIMASLTFAILLETGSINQSLSFLAPNLSYLFTSPAAFLVLLLICVLLTVLIVSVKYVESFKGALKSFF